MDFFIHVLNKENLMIRIHRKRTMVAGISGRILLVGVLLAVLVTGCDRGGKEVHVGFIGGLSERNLDLGQAGYKGMQLAAEQVNRAGGINGQMVVLDARDDAQNMETATKAAEELVAAKVEAVIGPFTSAMAAAMLPVFNRSQVLLISPTITGMDFYGKDDFMIRLNRTTRDNARDYARELLARRQRRVAAAMDTRNRAFTESWYNEFREAITKLGGEPPAKIDYESSTTTDYVGIMREMLAGGPDGLLFISGALDAARLAQQARLQAPQLPISAVEWAGSEQLIELGGAVVEGLLIVQNYNRTDADPRFREFQEAYYRRFQSEPGYGSVMAYDAAMVLFAALKKKTATETPKQAVLKYGPYQGLQQEIVFDSNGDTDHKVFFTEIRNGQFQVLGK
jgi:branched-chain amino acid transport system substrate-binding protein